MGKFKAWFTALSIGKKIAYGAVSLVTATTIVGAASPPAPSKPTSSPAQTTQVQTTQAQTIQTQEPKIEVKSVTEKQPVDFETQTVDDATLTKGQTAVRQDGKAGERTLVFEVTYSDGSETSRKQVSDTLSLQPVTKIVANGSKVEAPALSNNNTYTNVDGNTVHSPAYSSGGQPPAGATARCGDGTYSFSQHRQGTCSYHGGVAQWL